MSTPSYPSDLVKMDFGPTWLALPELGDSIDPFDFHQRMAAYKRLIDDSNAQGIFGTENQFNLFWGYVVQLHWQWTTSRLTLPQTPPDRIDPNALWSYGNHILCIIPLIAAMRVGITPEIEILPPSQPSKVEYVHGGGRAGAFVIPKALESAVNAWDTFFQLLKTMQAGDDLEPLRFKQWASHWSSLSAGEAGCEHLAGSCSKNEYDFFIGWIRMVDFLGAAAWRTDLEYMLKNGTDVLPARILIDQDVLGHIPDMSAEVNANINSVISLTRQSDWLFRFSLWVWKRAMRTRQARGEVLQMLDAVFSSTPQNANSRSKLLWYILAF
jgi:hypothetical protein